MPAYGSLYISAVSILAHFGYLIDATYLVITSRSFWRTSEISFSVWPLRSLSLINSLSSFEISIKSAIKQSIISFDHFCLVIFSFASFIALSLSVLYSFFRMVKIYFFLFSLKFLYSDSTLYLVPTGSFITFVSSVFPSFSFGSSGRIGLPYSSTSPSNSSISFSFFYGSEFGCGGF